MTPNQIKIYRQLLLLPIGDPYRPTYDGDFPPLLATLTHMSAPLEVLTVEARERALELDRPPAPVESPRVAVAASASDDRPSWQNVGRALGGVAGRLVEKVRWQRGRVFNPKILCVDVKVPKKPVPPPVNWARNIVETFARVRVINEDVSVLYFKAVVEVIEKIASDGAGFVQRAFKSIGRLAGLGRGEGDWGRETVRKCIRWLEANGRIGTFNALYRDDEGQLKRDANVYLLFSKDDAEEAMALEPTARNTSRICVANSPRIQLLPIMRQHRRSRWQRP